MTSQAIFSELGSGAPTTAATAARSASYRPGRRRSVGSRRRRQRAAELAGLLRSSGGASGGNPEGQQEQEQGREAGRNGGRRKEGEREKAP